MKNVTTSTTRVLHRTRGGFALLITITLLAFLVLLLVSLASLTRVETQVAGNSPKLSQARQNALMALTIAIAQLQKAAGPDQRTTIRADFGTGPLGNTLPLAVNGAKQWTGAIGNTAAQAATFTPAPVVLNWLVSGNENAVFTPSTGSGTFGQITSAPPGSGALVWKPDGIDSLPLSPATTATTPLSVGSKDYQLLVGSNTVGPTAGADQYVVAPLVSITGGSVPGVGGSPVIGRYAYWVGDEGIKARINLNNPYISANPRLGYQLAQRVATEMIDDDNTSFAANGTQLKTAFPVNGSTVPSVLSGEQVALLGSTTADQTTLQNAQKLRFHDITTSSHGVVSDSLRGGIKKDLSAALAATLSSDNTSLVASGYGSNATYLSRAGNVRWSDPIWDLSTGTKTPPAANPAAIDGTAATWISTPMAGTNGYDGKGPLWQMLRSYYQLPDNPAAAFSGTGSGATLNPIAQTDDSAGTAQQQGVAPVIVNYQLFIDTKVVSLGGGSYQLELRHVPAITLWNPYGVTLRSQPYHVTVSLEKSIFYARVVNTTAVSYADPAINADAQVSSPYFHDSAGNTGTGAAVNFTFTLESGAMAPGTAYVYTMAADLAATATSVPSPVPALVRGWGAGPSNGRGVVVTSGAFTLPVLPPINTYRLIFFTGGTGHGTTGAASEPGITTMPAWDQAPVAAPGTPSIPAVPPIDAVFLRLGGATGPLVQQVSGNNANFNAQVTTWPVPTSKGNQEVKPNIPSPVLPQMCFAWKVALQVTDQSPLPTTIPMPPVRWLSGYNPRAYQSYRSAYEIQGNGGDGYQKSNPSYAAVRPDINRTGTASATANYTINADDATFSSPTDVVSGNADFGYNYSAGSHPVILFDLPRPDSPLLSLGALQHAHLYRTLPESAVNPHRLASNFAPAYPVGNSWADPRVPLAAPAGSINAGSNKITGTLAAVFFDHSYLLNRTLWDAYFFSGISAGASATNADGSLNTRNSRLVAAGNAFRPADLHNTDRAAAGLLTAGAFNVNSTSVEAWRAVLAGTLNVPVGGTGRTDEAPVPRLLYPADDADVMTASSDASHDYNAYRGYRFLTRDQIDSLATAIVTEVKNRGPFLSLADFVNRSLVNVADGYSPGFDERTLGALARALQTVQQSTLAKQPNGGFGTTLVETIPALGVGASKMPGANQDGTETTTTTLLATGAPGFITQADLLQPLGPALSARSDTFLIRVYGDAVNPLGVSADPDYVQSRAWCEAVVQRLPEYVDATQDAWEFPSAAHPANQTFGRRFKIISFKWLSSSDI